MTSKLAAAQAYAGQMQLQLQAAQGAVPRTRASLAAKEKEVRCTWPWSSLCMLSQMLSSLQAHAEHRKHFEKHGALPTRMQAQRYATGGTCGCLCKGRAERKHGEGTFLPACLFAGLFTHGCWHESDESDQGIWNLVAIVLLSRACRGAQCL